MSVLSNIEFSILNTNLVKETEDSKKIKFKHESYLRIWKKYDSFCVETKEKMSPKFSNLPEQTEVKQPIGPENIVVHIKNRTYKSPIYIHNHYSSNGSLILPQYIYH